MFLWNVSPARELTIQLTSTIEQWLYPLSEKSLFQLDSAFSFNSSAPEHSDQCSCGMYQVASLARELTDTGPQSGTASMS